MKFLIVTGMSGAGKSTAIRFFEDLGYYCIDNLPPMLIPEFINLLSHKSCEYKQVVLGIDIRGGTLFQDLFKNLKSVEEMGFDYEILFMDCEDDTLIKRYKETRRMHPLARNERIGEGIEKERFILHEVKNHSDYIIDTTHLSPKDVQKTLQNLLEKETTFRNLMVTIVVFGFKYGIPIDADLVFDVRFLPNPYYDLELRPLTGNSLVIKDFVMKHDISKQFFNKLRDLIDFLIPHYVEEGKNQLVIGIGCTGGKHRSVVIGNELYDALRKSGNSVTIQHRDIDKDQKRGK